MTAKSTLMDYAKRNPFFLDNSQEREAISRGAFLQEIYESEHDKGEIEGPRYENSERLIITPPRNIEIPKPKSIDSLFIPKGIFNFVLKNIPLPGKARFYGNISPTILGDYNEKGYLLNLSSQQWNRRINQSFGFGLENGEEEPEAKEYLIGINDFLIDRGYDSRVNLEESALEINGYKDNFLRKEKMEEILTRGKDKTPLMREFLVANFPHSNYGEGESHDLLRRSATAVEMRFNKKYSYVKSRCKSALEK